MSTGNGNEFGNGQRLMPLRPPLPPTPSELRLMSTEEVDFGELVQRTARDAAHLVEQEGLLFKREIELEIEHLKGTIAIGTVGAIVATLTLFTATATAILVLALVLPAWTAALIVATAWGAFSAIGLSALAMVRLDDQTTTPRPEIAERSVRRDAHGLMQAVGGE